MAIAFKCLQCGKSYQTPDNLAGKTINCRACGAPMAVPGGAPVAAPVPAPVPHVQPASLPSFGTPLPPGGAIAPQSGRARPQPMDRRLVGPDASAYRRRRVLGLFFAGPCDDCSRPIRGSASANGSRAAAPWHGQASRTAGVGTARFRPRRIAAIRWRAPPLHTTAATTPLWSAITAAAFGESMRWSASA